MKQHKTLIIAEAGVNHNGSLALAYQLVDEAVNAGVDIVKFQTFVTDELVTKNALQAQYQQRNMGKQQSQYEMLKQLELSFDDHKALQRYCESKGIEYFSTAFDLPSLSLLADEMQIKRLKIPSGELTNGPYVLAHARKKKPLIVSTGMATLDEIKQALGIIAFGLLNPISETSELLSLDVFDQAYNSQQGQQALADYVSLLHCTTEYPAPIDTINLAAMALMQETFGLPVGYSDHSEGIFVPTVAVAQGACIIEKHFTLSKEMEGPDHKASIEPHELKQLVENVRQVERINGVREKKPAACEQRNMAVARKSLVAAVDIEVGATFSEHNIAVKRPGSGISPMRYWETLGKKAKKSFLVGDLIEL